MYSKSIIPIQDDMIMTTANDSNKSLTVSLPDGNLISNLNETEVKETIKNYIVNNTINNYNYTINVDNKNNFIFLIPIVTSA